MGPSCRRKTRKSSSSSSSSSSSRRRTLLKKKLESSKNNQETSAVYSSTAKPSNNDLQESNISGDVVSDEMCSTSACSTPKAERFRIPEIGTCPPAPKKRRISTASCSLRRTSIAFFAPPDIESFFNFALCGIPV